MDTFVVLVALVLDQGGQNTLLQIIDDLQLPHQESCTEKCPLWLVVSTNLPLLSNVTT